MIVQTLGRDAHEGLESGFLSCWGRGASSGAASASIFVSASSICAIWLCCANPQGIHLLNPAW